MFNGWYFFWLILSTVTILGLYFGLRDKSAKWQKGVLFGLLAFGLLLHFLKVYIPPYSVDEARMLRDSWFVNICGANIALFPFFFWSKNDKIKDAAVIGLPDSRLGGRGAINIELKEGETMTEEEVNLFCAELPRYKRPRKIIFADIPRNPTGKIEKPVLRRRYGAGNLIAEENEIKR